MTRDERFRKIASAVLGELTDQMMKLLQKGSLIDMYYNLTERLVEMQRLAYDDGYRKGRADVTDEVVKFDMSRDEVGS